MRQLLLLPANECRRCARNTTAATIKQKLLFVGREDGKLLALRQLLAQGIQPPVLVFVQSKERARQLFHELGARALLPRALGTAG